MKPFKQVDILLQTLIIVATIAVVIINADDSLGALLIGCLVFFGGMSVWQVISAIVHFAKLKWSGQSAGRKVYLILLPFALLICFAPFPMSDDRNSLILLAIITGFAMAAYYYGLTIIEYRKESRK